MSNGTQKDKQATYIFLLDLLIDLHDRYDHYNKIALREMIDVIKYRIELEQKQIVER